MAHKDHSFKDAFRVKKGLEVLGGTILHGGVEIEGVANIPDINIDINDGRISSLSARVIDNDPNAEYSTSTGTAYYPLSVIPETHFFDDVRMLQNVHSDGNITNTGTLTTTNITSDSINSTILAGNTLSVYTSSVLIGSVSAKDDVHVYGDLRVDGDVFFNANNSGGTNTINLGDDGNDNVVFKAVIDSDMIPSQNMTHDIGTAEQHWNVVYTHDLSAHGKVYWTGGSSDDIQNIITTLETNSGNWISTNNAVYGNSANWGDTYTTVGTYSGDWEDTHTTVGTYSGDWEDVHSQVQILSTGWQDTYTHMGHNMASWIDTTTVVQNNSASWATGGGGSSDTIGNYENFLHGFDNIEPVNPYATIDIMDTEANILAMTGVETGTLAFATDTNNLYVYNETNIDSWTLLDDN